jgi:diguanylate cyclase (GGDEF)-like protein
MRTLPTVSIGTAALLAAASAALVSHRNLRRELASTRVELADARELAFRDSLTGLANRAAIDVELTRRGAGSEPYAVVLVDLDLFKLVNDTHGHGAGDMVLVETARRLCSLVDPHRDLVGRLGGDEFVILASAPLGWLGWKLAQDAADVMRAPISVVDKHGRPQQVEVTASVGVLNAMPGDDLASVKRSADVALYWAKAAGRNRSVEFGPDAPLIPVVPGERPQSRLREGGALAGVTR